jgi:hyperosmotically inducible periplasmic protein
MEAVLVDRPGVQATPRLARPQTLFRNDKGARYMKIAIMIPLVLAVAACDRAERTSADGQVTTTTATDHVAADNTKKNERDKGPSALTPMDQGENEYDRTITQNIRQGVIKDDAFSTTAKNIKIITQNGVVTLRGPVKSDKEKNDVVAIAQRVEGVKRVDNQLEIASN